jgi:hypothetical protein
VEKVVRKYKLGEDPNDLDLWLTKSYLERLQALEKLRENYIHVFLNEHRPRFQRVYRVIK